jgi:uncharacterized protein (UPF0262 family)
MDDGDQNFRISTLILAGDLAKRQSSDVEHERQVAIYDLTEENYFRPTKDPQGPYRLELWVIENRLRFDIQSESGDLLGQFILSLTPFRRLIRDYHEICQSYYEAIRTAHPSKIEAIDMARRGLHNETAELLLQRLEGKIQMDLPTARRFITLIASLYLKSSKDLTGIGGGRG